MKSTMEMIALLEDVRKCDICFAELPNYPRPIVQATSSSKLLIIGQAPGTKVQKTGIPFNDPSGDLLRRWLDLSTKQFYDDSLVALMPMGFCYPGKGASGDKPPRKECAPNWHARLLEQMPQVELILLVGSYAQNYYLPESNKQSVVDRVSCWQSFLPYFPLPHPSPRNRHWLQKNSWFEQSVVPELQKRVSRIIT